MKVYLLNEIVNHDGVHETRKLTSNIEEAIVWGSTDVDDRFNYVVLDLHEKETSR